MTDDRADVIEQAAKVIADRCKFQRFSAPILKYGPMDLARTLADAGLLATPTDQDNAGLAGRMARIAAIHRDDADDLRAKLERAEDEVAELRAEARRLDESDSLQRAEWSLAIERAERAEVDRDHAQQMAEMAERDRRTAWLDAERALAERDRERSAVMELRGVHRRAERAEAERDQLRAQVAAVRALADEWRVRQNGRVRGFAARIDTALDTAGGEKHE